MPAKSRPTAERRAPRRSREALPVVAIVGRANVGKSTLFNRLVGKRLALVDDTPGVTRDRREGEARLAGTSLRVIDTAGFEIAAEETLTGRMRRQTEAAIAGADILFFMVDARAGVTPLDAELAALARRSGKPVLLLANKAEGRAGELASLDAWSLGIGEPLAISAEHGEGMEDLRTALKETLQLLSPPVARDDVEPAARADAREDLSMPGDETAEPCAAPAGPIQIAVVGRPNAGKSTLVNRLLGEERLLTGAEPGITRDAIGVDWSWRGRAFRLVDTAGLRRKSRVTERLEKLSTADAVRALRFAEVVIVVLDATIPFEKQDLQIVDLVEREGRAPVVALDKWDLIEDRDRTLAAMREAAGRLLPQIAGVRVVPVSGLTGYGLDRLTQAVVAAHRAWSARITTARLNRWLAAALERHPPPAPGGRRIRVRYMTQAKSRPPTFVAFCSRPEELPAAYRRYLVNGLRETFDLRGIPIRLMLRKGENPYAGR